MTDAHPPRTRPRSKSAANPASALPMPGLSERAQRLLTRRSHRAFGVELEPAGGGLARFAKTKASI